ncbi:DUF5698 domain-containing protein [Salidesulfovibrio brasiliensis]
MAENTIILGILIFLAEVVVLTIGTVRTMMTVQGETKMAFWLGALEMTVWVMGTSAVIAKVGEVPFLGVCYALGFAVGNVTGIWVERKIALGHVVVRFISPVNGRVISSAMRNAGFGTTVVAGEGSEGPVTVQFVVCRRKDLKQVISIARTIDPDVFYTYENAGVAHCHRPSPQQCPAEQTASDFA